MTSGAPAGPPGQPRVPTTPPAVLPVPKEDFDFQAAMEKFRKEEVAKVGSHSQLWLLGVGGRGMKHQGA